MQESNLLGCHPVVGLAHRSLPGRPTLPVSSARLERAHGQALDLAPLPLGYEDSGMGYVDRAGFEPAISRMRVW